MDVGGVGVKIFESGKIIPYEAMAAAIAGDYGIPTVFVSGDDKITAKIKDKIPGIETAEVKQTLSAYIRPTP